MKRLVLKSLNRKVSLHRIWYNGSVKGLPCFLTFTAHLHLCFFRKKVELLSQCQISNCCSEVLKCDCICTWPFLLRAVFAKLRQIPCKALALLGAAGNLQGIHTVKAHYSIPRGIFPPISNKTQGFIVVSIQTILPLVTWYFSFEGDWLGKKTHS